MIVIWPRGELSRRSSAVHAGRKKHRRCSGDSLDVDLARTAGITFSRDGTRLFVGVEDKGVVEYDTSAGARTSFATGSLRL